MHWQQEHSPSPPQGARQRQEQEEEEEEEAGKRREEPQGARQEPYKAKEWACVRCTFLNGPNALACGVCTSPKPATAPASSTAETAEAGLANVRARSMSSGGAAKPSQPPQVSIAQLRLGVSVAFLLEFTEKHQKSGKLLPTDSSKDVVENIIKSETAGAKCSFVDHLAASKDELESKWWQQYEHAGLPRKSKQTFFSGSTSSPSTSTAPTMSQSPWTNPVPLTRAWCLWEILCTSRTKATFEIILPPKEEQSLLESLVTRFDSIAAMLATVDVANAKAWKAEDQKKILEAVAETGEGVHGLNKLVVEQLRDWLAKTAKAAIPEEPSSNDPLSLINSVANLLSDQGKLAEAEPLYRRALAGYEEELGATHPDTLVMVNNLAVLLKDQGKMAEAEPLYRRALAGREEKLGATHPDTLVMVNNLAILLSDQGKLAEAEPLYRRALAGYEEELGATHPDTLVMVNNLAGLLKDQGKLAEAEPLYRRALAGKEEKLGATHPDTLATVNNLAVLLYDQGKLAEAEPLYRRALAGREEKLGATHPSTLASVYNLALLMKAERNVAEAKDLMRRAAKGYESVYGPSHPETLDAMQQLRSLDD
eukprot:g7102.t1